jgi:hypothetical protein
LFELCEPGELSREVVEGGGVAVAVSPCPCPGITVLGLMLRCSPGRPNCNDWVLVIPAISWNGDPVMKLTDLQRVLGGGVWERVGVLREMEEGRELWFRGTG